MEGEATDTGRSRLRSLGIGFLVLLAFLAAGRLAAWGLALPVPGSVLGMVLLAAALLGGAIRVEVVKPCADLLLKHLGFFFVPAGVGLIQHFDLLGEQWLPILAGTVVSTIAVLVVGGGAAAFFTVRRGRG